jgi:hypothetical protein
MLDNIDLKIKIFYVVTDFPASYFKVTDSNVGPAMSYTS